jgi:trk system potassium uptake protein TrkA
MKIVIMGCSRLAAMVARSMAENGHSVTVIDVSEDNLRRLSNDSSIKTIIGDGTLMDSLQHSGVPEADIFLALEDRDSRNALAAQKVQQAFPSTRSICSINDPTRQAMYTDLGLEALSPAAASSKMILYRVNLMILDATGR